MKSTEYKATDDAAVQANNTLDEEEEEDEVEGFNFQRLRELYPDQVPSLVKLKTALLESTNEMAPLKVWQFQDLSQQAAQRILDAPHEDQLRTLVHIAQNFPVQARSLVSVKVSAEFRKELKHNQDQFINSLSLGVSEAALYMNGLYFDVDLIDVGKLLDTVRHELRVMQGLFSIGITDESLQKLLSLDLSPSSKTEYGLDIRDSAVQWINDIEKDGKYTRWSFSLMDLLRPTFPGMLRNIRRNLYSLVIICNPAHSASIPLLKLVESFYVHSAPLRIGLVFNVHPDTGVTGLQDGGVALLNAFNYVQEAKRPHEALAFITEVYAKVKPNQDVSPEDVINTFSKQFSSVNIDEVFGVDTDYNTGRQLVREFIARTGLVRQTPQVLMNGIPLPETSLTAEDFEESILTEIIRQTPKFQKAVYKGELTDNMDVGEYVMTRPNIMPRLNERVLNKDSSSFVDLTLAESDQMLRLVQYRTSEKTSVKPGGTSSTPAASSSSICLITHWIVVDLSSEDSLAHIQSAVDYLRTEPGSRVGFLVNPGDPSTEAQHLAFLAALEAGFDISTSLTLGLEAKPPATIEQLKNTDWSAIGSLYTAHVNYVRSVVRFGPGQVGLITNGRVIGPLQPGEAFTAADFSLLDRLTLSLYTEKIYESLKGSEPKESLGNDMLLKTISILIIRPNTRVRFSLPALETKYSAIKLEPRNSSEPVFDLQVIVDPVSRAAQKIGPILKVLQSVLNTRITIFMNCVEKNSDMPLKSFYRFVLEPEPSFTADGASLSGPVAKFLNMPSEPLLTQNLHVPDNWLVESIATPYDLDNIKLENVDSNVHSEYELEYLLLEGHCFESPTGNPPRGLQMTLGTSQEPVQVDTIVMANLGYFQMKANPGAWVLRLRQGRSDEIYDITHHAGSDTPVNSTDIKILISSFKSHILDVKVTKKPDKVHMDLLSEDGAENAGLWNSITSTFGGKDETTGESGEDRINIFSVASGHLYERFLRIMMLSVLKHTKTPVKFWFLKNYLSPTFKDFLPRMAKAYKFEYELVQYKWPRWLTQQTEKQRIIWGYKILFLDVLFPLDVKKIIFVDADQVVRADMKELVDYDLGSAPYGYVPFCDSRREMDGFRFWNQGYWRNHLQGRKYHISALYVVDLKRFRKIAAGDRLRGQYQALSQDPNSLSNLDQDLPNNMIHQVPIKSLPQEWLWCETWCDESSKTKAKTIDLCNNPLTKEAKLSAAVRIVQEWKQYDSEIKRLQLSLGEGLESEESGPEQQTIQHTEL
uniref:UDP-glucose:glycoprotein glucosyltransferase 1 n=3 Tax=Cacopsylla melanoneura TaxID=428564 RepID=A0A8D8UU44_9HEMI